MPAGVDDEYARAIGDAIARARKARGMSQEQLRLRVGNSKNAVSSWERGKSAPTVQNLRELCRVLDVPPSQLLGMNGGKPVKTHAPAAELQALAARLGELRRDAEAAVPDLMQRLTAAEAVARRLGGFDT
jgi:transcriptional regulator with XRE-family HTH domain